MAGVPLHDGSAVSHHLVTGGAGFVGSALVSRLIDEGHEVTVLDRFSRGKRGRVPDAARIVKGDIRDQSVVLRAALEADTIWHLAYVQGTQTFYADPKDVIDVALRGIMNVPRRVRTLPRQGTVPRLLERGLPEPARRHVSPPTRQYPCRCRTLRTRATRTVAGRSHQSSPRLPTRRPAC